MVAFQVGVDAMLKNIFSSMFGQASQATRPATLRVSEARSAEPAPKSDHVRLRAPLREVDLILSRAAEVWLMSLPQSLRPAALCSAYPRVAGSARACRGPSPGN
jgi:hypothetical protein